jgi:hypothetical protein
MRAVRSRTSLVSLVLAVGVAALVVGLTGSGRSSPASASGPFAWLRPAPGPNNWLLAKTPWGPTFAYPPGWRMVKSDPDAVSVALIAPDGLFRAYLNATPRSGAETPANWSRFRPAHNQREGARDERLLASAENLRFRSGRGSCVIDAYTTSKARYQEIACLVTGPRSSTVIVAAAPSRQWQREAPTLERAVSSFVS